MEFDFVQTSTDLFAAAFSMISGGEEIGRMQLKGAMATNDGVWTGGFRGQSLRLARTDKSGLTDKNAFRPYSIEVDGTKCGTVFQTMRKESFFSQYDFDQMFFGGLEYSLYVVGLGQNGYKIPIFCGESQVALCEEECTVYNGLYRYHVVTLDNNGALVSALFCCYMFLLGSYKPGVKIKASVETNTFTSRNKTLNAKYDPTFKSRAGY